jgi:regulator of sigma E protease
MIDPVTLLLFVLFFGFMLFVHEFGHYLFAKLFKINVDEFGFGYPPRLLKLFKIKETEFTINMIPFGAFVRLSGENDPEVPGGFGSAKPWKRIIVLLGGPLMNLATGALLFTLLFNQIGVPDTSKVMIASVAENSPAAQAGILPGDLIAQVNQTPISDDQTLVQLIQENKGKEIEMVLQRGDQKLTVRAVPRVNPPPGEGALGVGLTTPMVPVPWIKTIPISVKATIDQSVAILQMPGMLIRGEVPKEQARVVGVVGIYSMFSQARERDVENQASTDPFEKTFTLRLLILISIALGLTNLFPIPALDGGRILFILPELLFRKRIPPRYENLVHLIGFVTLIALMFYITAMDIINPVRLP